MQLYGTHHTFSKYIQWMSRQWQFLTKENILCIVLCSYLIIFCSRLTERQYLFQKCRFSFFFFFFRNHKTLTRNSAWGIIDSPNQNSHKQTSKIPCMNQLFLGCDLVYQLTTETLQHLLSAAVKLLIWTDIPVAMSECKIELLVFQKIYQIHRSPGPIVYSDNCGHLQMWSIGLEIFYRAVNIFIKSRQHFRSKTSFFILVSFCIVLLVFHLFNIF